jgi:hypothetical protein
MTALEPPQDTTTQAQTPQTYEAPTDPEKLITWAERKRRKGRARMPEYQMKLNLAYLIGQQQLAWDPDRRLFQRPIPRTDDPNAPIRITANKVGGIVEHYISRLTSNAPDAQIRPVGDTEKDIDASKAGTRILQSENRRLRWDVWVMAHFFWVVTHGWAYGQVMWDPNKGDNVGTLNAGSTDPSKPEQQVNQGEVVIDSVPAYELSVDPDAMNMKDAKWCIRTRVMSKEAVWEQYGKVPQGAEPVRSIADEVYALTNASSRASEQRADTVGVHQLWLLPCRAAKKGIVFTWCGQTVLEPVKDFPYNHKRLPYVQWNLLPGMGRREGRTWMDDLIPLQADYNDARSREAAIRRTLTPKLVGANGSVDTTRLSSRVEFLGYNPGMGDKPTLMIPDSGWMAQYESSMNRAQSEMSDRAGESAMMISRASAAAIMALQQINDTKVFVSQRLLTDAIEETSWHVLELIKQFWTEDRMVSTYSEIGQLEVAHFSGADVDHQLDIYVNVEMGEKTSKAATIQLGLDLWKAQVITDPRHLLRLLQVPDASFLADEFNIDARQAQRENEILMQGTPIAIHDFDVDAVHIVEHDNQRKGEDYEKLEAMANAGDPQAQKVLAAMNAHVDAHHQQQAMKQSAQAKGQSAGKLIEDMAFKDVPPDAQQQMLVQAGFDPSAFLPTPGNPSQNQPHPAVGGTGGLAAAAGAAVAHQGAFGHAQLQQAIAKRAGIGGGLGQQGHVPGVSSNEQAHRTGQ